MISDNCLPLIEVCIYTWRLRIRDGLERGHWAGIHVHMQEVEVVLILFKSSVLPARGHSWE